AFPRRPHVPAQFSQGRPLQRQSSTSTSSPVTYTVVVSCVASLCTSNSPSIKNFATVPSSDRSGPNVVPWSLLETPVLPGGIETSPSSCESSEVLVGQSCKKKVVRVLGNPSVRLVRRCTLPAPVCSGHPRLT